MCICTLTIYFRYKREKKDAILRDDAEQIAVQMVEDESDLEGEMMPEGERAGRIHTRYTVEGGDININGNGDDKEENEKEKDGHKESPKFKLDDSGMLMITKNKSNDAQQSILNNETVII